MSEDLRLTIVCDTREQDPLPIKAYPVSCGTLTSGDYSVAGLEREFAIERKSIPDLVMSLTSERDRFSREMERLRGYRFARLLIIGWPGQIEMGQYRSRVAPEALMHSLYAFEARYVPVVWAKTPQDGAELVERWSFWFARSVAEAAKRLSKACETAAEVSA